MPAAAAPGPARGIRFIHRAIAADITSIEADARSADHLAALGPRVEFLTRVLRFHSKGEEESIFPEIEAKVSDVIAPYLLDHREEEPLFAALRGGIASSSQSDTLRAATALRQHLQVHIKKEEELLVPLIERLFTPAEQAAQVGKMMAAFAPPDLAVVAPWLVRLLSPADRKDYLAMVQAAMPPERLAAVASWLKGGLSPELWSEVIAAAPQLAKLA